MQDQNGIYITKKQASVTASILVLLTLLVFITGYFWGKQSVIAEFSQKTSQDSFNDQVDYVLTMQSFAAKHGTVLDEDSADLQKDLPDAMEETGKSEAVVAEVVQPSVKPVVASTMAVHAVKKDASSAVAGKQHWAALVGFGKKSSALAMINRLKKYRIDLELKTKTSKSASGASSRIWYQVVTPKFEDSSELQALVDRVVAIEHLRRKDVKIF